MQSSVFRGGGHDDPAAAGGVVRRTLLRRLAHLSAEGVTGEEVRAALAALERGEEAAGQAADLARAIRAFSLATRAQDHGGVAPDRVAGRCGFASTAAELAAAAEAVEGWHRRCSKAGAG